MVARCVIVYSFNAEKRKHMKSYRNRLLTGINRVCPK